jgi:hypothetical protein
MSQYQIAYQPGERAAQDARDEILQLRCREPRSRSYEPRYFVRMRFTPRGSLAAAGLTKKVNP